MKVNGIAAPLEHDRLHVVVEQGSRTTPQIFEGPIPGPLMTDIFDFTMYIDSRDWVVPLSFDPIYEIDEIDID